MTCSGPDVLNTPSYASGTIMGIFIAISLVIERSIHYLGRRFERKKQGQLLKALEAMKEELMLLGFISLFLTVFQDDFATICVRKSRSAFNFLLCNLEELPEVREEYATSNATEVPTAPHRRRLLASSGTTCSEGHTPFIGVEALHQIHTFIFTLALVHIIYSCIVMTLAYFKVESWAKWEKESINDAKAYQARKDDPAKKAEMDRVTTFQKRHEEKAEIWLLDWAHCLVKSIYRAVAKPDYKALRVAFLESHHLNYDFAFHKFLLRSLEADYSHVVGVTPFMWVFVVFFVIFDIPRGHIVYWLPDIFVSCIILVGGKLARVVQSMARDIDLERMGPCIGRQMKPRDSLFWFKRPGILLWIMHFTLFTNSFQLATVIFYAWQFGIDSCYFFNRPFTYLRVIISVTLILFTSWVTLPTYALVSQMSSHFRPTIFGEHVQHHIHGWTKRAKAKQAPATESGTLREKIESVLHLNHADSGTTKDGDAGNKSGSSNGNKEDESDAEVEEVVDDGDVERAMRPPAINGQERVGNQTVNGTGHTPT